MLFVAVTAVLLAVAALLGRRRNEYLRLVAYHAERWKLPPGGGSVFGNMILGQDPKTGKRIYKSLEELDYHARMIRKYQHAASYPWLPVEPDPPEPEFPR
jgi:hypothetical protein